MSVDDLDGAIGLGRASAVAKPVSGGSADGESPQGSSGPCSPRPRHVELRLDGKSTMNLSRLVPPEPVLRDAVPAEIATFLRVVMGLSPTELAPGELAATLRRSMPSVVHGLDSGAWIAWCLSGLVLFAEGLPVMEWVRVESKRVVMALAMLHSGGNITAAAEALGTSRRALRESLRGVGLYPWQSWSGERRGGGRREGSEGYGGSDGFESERGELPESARSCRPIVPGAEPEVVEEDGVKGVVWFKLEDVDYGGPAWLVRGERCELMFRGRWIHWREAKDYALEHGHEFRRGGDRPTIRSL